MLKKHMKYTDFDENEREEDFYFHLTEAELAELELSHNDGLTKFVEKIIAEKDQARLVEFFKDFVLKTVGEKSFDGKMFVKNEKIRENFASTQAYSDLFMELATNAGAAAAFINAVVPKKIQDRINSQSKTE